jgi:hypothetical protein
MALDLEDILLVDLEIRQGVGDVEVILPSGDYDADLSLAVGQLVVWVPEDYPIRLEISRAITTLDLPGDFQLQNGYHYSPNARGADDILTIEINQAIGNIEVRYLK